MDWELTIICLIMFFAGVCAEKLCGVVMRRRRRERIRRAREAALQSPSWVCERPRADVLDILDARARIDRQRQKKRTKSYPRDAV
jgi:hypothetical protein